MIGDVLDFLGGGGDSAAREIQSRVLADAKNLPLPVLKEYYPDLYEVVAQMNPELETAIELGPSKMAGIATDPKLRQAQLNALSRLEQIGLGEQSAEDLARSSQIISDVNTNLQGQQGAIMQNLASRGMSGGGSELVARNIAAQGAANRQAQMSMDAKADAERRALEAIIQSGNLGGQMQSRDFAQEAARAEAADAINRFNVQNRQNVMGQNVSAKNQAQQFNAQTANQAAQSNVDTRNAANLRNLNLTQQQYENELRKKGLVTGAQQDLAANYQNQAAQNRQFIGGLVGAGAKAFTGGK